MKIGKYDAFIDSFYCPVKFTDQDGIDYEGAVFKNGNAMKFRLNHIGFHGIGFDISGGPESYVEIDSFITPADVIDGDGYTLNEIVCATSRLMDKIERINPQFFIDMEGA